MLRYFFVIFFAGVLVVVALAGFRGMRSTERPIEIFPDMDDQPKYRPQHGSEFWADGRAARPPVEGTVPIGYSDPESMYLTSASNSRVTGGASGFGNTAGYADTGRMGGEWGDGIPIDVTLDVVARGKERYAIHCAICHGDTGMGDGIVKQYGLATIVTLQDERIRTMPDGEIFNTITHGKNTMGSYGGRVAVEDRWAIIAYLRALQRSQNATPEDVPDAELVKLEPAAAAPAAEDAAAPGDAGTPGAEPAAGQPEAPEAAPGADAPAPPAGPSIKAVEPEPTPAAEEGGES